MIRFAWLTVCLVLSAGIAAAQGTAASTIRQCAFDACQSGDCCKQAQAQLAGCRDAHATNRGIGRNMASSYLDGSEAESAHSINIRVALRGTHECMRCAAVYLEAFCDRVEPEASLQPTPIDLGRLERTLESYRVHPDVVAEYRRSIAPRPTTGGSIRAEDAAIAISIIGAFAGAMARSGGGGGARSGGGGYCARDIGQRC